MTIPVSQPRVMVQYRALPLETLNITWLQEPAGNFKHGEMFLRPGQLGPASVDEYGMQYGRLVGNAAAGVIPLPIGANTLTTSILGSEIGLNTAACLFGYISASNAYTPIAGLNFGATTALQGLNVAVATNAALYLHDGSTTNVVAVSADQSYAAPGTIPRGVQFTTDPVTWAVDAAGAVGAIAIATRAAGAAGERHVCRSITASFISVAAVAAFVEIQLRDGVSGAGAILWRTGMNTLGSLANNQVNINISSLNIVGSVATAMTLEFSVAGAGARESLTITGYTIPA